MVSNAISGDFASVKVDYAWGLVEGHVGLIIPFPRTEANILPEISRKTPKREMFFLPGHPYLISMESTAR